VTPDPVTPDPLTSDALTVNAGSTSVKVTRFDGDHPDGRPETLDDALAGPAPTAVLHRVVHGGTRTAPEVLDADEVEELRKLTDLAPLHQPPALDAIDRCRAAWPDAVHVACFDTTFHASMPEAARTYALPERWRQRVRGYGFHGLAHAWASGQVSAAAPNAGRVLVAHLGGGASLCAVRDGRSVATTMGFTPLDGLVMATRSGTVDPGALLWMSAHSDEDLEHVLDSESGLLGLCGTSDMREVQDRSAQGDGQARLALDVWLHRFLRQAGGMIAVLGGLDALAFSGGIGEHSPLIRRMVTDALRFVGVDCADVEIPSDSTLTEVTASGAAVRTFVVHAREDLQMLTEARHLLR
jgi:acetate kinase